MPSNIRQISIDLLERMYSHGFNSFYKENLKELYSNYRSQEIKKAIERLYDSGKIIVHSIKWFSHDFFLKDFSGHITEKGILEVENYDFSDEKKNSVEIARFLEAVSEAEENNLRTSDIVEKVKLKGSRKTKKMLISLLNTVIQVSCKAEKLTSHTGGTYSDLYIYTSTSPITDYGYHVLELYERSTQLFKSQLITNQEMLRREYNSLQILINNQLWKDVCIKIGAILEYLLTKWLKSKGISQIPNSRSKKLKGIGYTSFKNKIIYYLGTARIEYNNEIGDKTSWNIVKEVIREYRNCVHLEKYEDIIKTDGYLEKKDYEQLLPVFELILQYF